MNVNMSGEGAAAAGSGLGIKIPGLVSGGTEAPAERETISNEELEK